MLLCCCCRCRSLHLIAFCISFFSLLVAVITALCSLFSHCVTLRRTWYTRGGGQPVRVSEQLPDQSSRFLFSIFWMCVSVAVVVCVCLCVFTLLEAMSTAAAVDICGHRLCCACSPEDQESSKRKGCPWRRRWFLRHKSAAAAVDDYQSQHTVTAWQQLIELALLLHLIDYSRTTSGERKGWRRKMMVVMMLSHTGPQWHHH